MKPIPTAPFSVNLRSAPSLAAHSPTVGVNCHLSNPFISKKPSLAIKVSKLLSPKSLLQPVFLILDILDPFENLS